MFRHTYLRLRYSMDGPTEIGGLIVTQAMRGHPERIGKLISWVRFLYICRHLARFEPRIVAAMLALVAVALTVISAASVSIFHNYLIGQADSQIAATFQQLQQDIQARRSLPMRPGDIFLSGPTVTILRPPNGQLDPHDGRDWIIEAYQEALDLVVYLKAEIIKRDGARG